MGVTDPELSVVISGQYPMSFMENEFPIYGETCICDDDSLASFFERPDTFSSHISITMLVIYASIQRRNIIQELNDDEYDFRGSTYLPNLNIGVHGGLVQQETIFRFGRQSNVIRNPGVMILKAH
ncbi:hypothetical protein HAX54_002223 [Datura stramonium]|uniref:Uncharacterized protein n=1 Tax=Datura stramonium TaxID=4076 RepID=A0ABS8RWA2_DATST|nr:hypothetical protein [Datura stramonium]